VEIWLFLSGYREEFFFSSNSLPNFAIGCCAAMFAYNVDFSPQFFCKLAVEVIVPRGKVEINVGEFLLEIGKQEDLLRC